eukprot:6193353-Pleurochrysis_carterae.AAC.8
MKAPFGSEKKGADVPHARSSDDCESERWLKVAFAHVHCHSLQFSQAWKGGKERTRPQANALWHLRRARYGDFITFLTAIPYPAPDTVFGYDKNICMQLSGRQQVIFKTITPIQRRASCLLGRRVI